MVFDVIPAIDLKGGRCVRLWQGDFDRETVFSDDPAAVAARWTDAGARTLHVVDLDGAASGEPANFDALRAIRRATAAVIQCGGGMRTDESIDRALDAGVDRVVLGTALVTRPDWAAEVCERLPDRIVAGIDARDGEVATAGWRSGSSLATAEIVSRVNELGIARGLFTDISRDGTLAGPNLEALRAVLDIAAFEVVASGGVATIEHIEAIRAAGACGVIVGRALYTGQVDLREAIAAAAAPFRTDLQARGERTSP